MRIHKVGIDEFKVDSYWMKLKTPIFEAKLSLNLTTKKIISHKKDRYFDREISWLSFNERVLLKAYDKAIPFGERLRFVTISSENLDEFYMVRIAGLLQLISQGSKIVPETGMRADELLKSAVGLGLRFIYIFCGGYPKNLEKIKLKIKKNKLICKIKPEAKSLMDKEVERRLKNFANASNLNYEIV